MSEENTVESQAESVPEVTQEVADNIFETAGRKFDLSTEAGRVGLKNFVDGLSFVTGKMSNELGELRKEVAPIRKYNLTEAEVDDISIMREVEKLRANGEDDMAFKLMFEYNKQVQKAEKAKSEFEKLFTDYLFQNKSVRDNLTPVELDIYKDYVRRNYFSELASSQNPFAVLDAVFGDKARGKQVSQAAPAAPQETGYASLPSAKATPPSPKEPERPEKASFDSLIDEFNKFSGF